MCVTYTVARSNHFQNVFMHLDIIRIGTLALQMHNASMCVLRDLKSVDRLPHFLTRVARSGTLGMSFFLSYCVFCATYSQAERPRLPDVKSSGHSARMLYSVAIDAI